MTGLETFAIGDRVRLKGDLGDKPGGVWMTVIRYDEAATDPQRPGVNLGAFCAVGYWTVTDKGAAILAIVDSIRPAALTKEPVPDRPSRAPVRLAKPTLKRARR